MAIGELRGKRVLVTGAASGIGRATALAFAKRGAHLVVSDLSADALASLQDEAAPFGIPCRAFACNVTNEADVAALADAAGPVDILVNNAGIAFLGGFMDNGIAEWRRILDVNLMGVVHMTRAFLPGMRAAGTPAAIVNVASTAGFAPAPSMSAYAASKHAVVGLSEVLAMELAGTGIVVSIVAPGVINTNITRGPSGMSDDQLKRLQDYYAAEGCDPSVVAEDIVKGVMKGKAVIETGPFAKLACRMMRLSRMLTRKVTLMNAKKLGYL